QRVGRGRGAEEREGGVAGQDPHDDEDQDERPEHRREDLGQPPGDVAHATRLPSPAAGSSGPPPPRWVGEGGWGVGGRRQLKGRRVRSSPQIGSSDGMPWSFGPYTIDSGRIMRGTIGTSRMSLRWISWYICSRFFGSSSRRAGMRSASRLYFVIVRAPPPGVKASVSQMSGSGWRTQQWMAKLIPWPRDSPPRQGGWA